MEEDGDDEEGDDGEDALAAKQELIQSYNVLGPIVGHAKEVAMELKEGAVTEVRASCVSRQHWGGKNLFFLVGAHVFISCERPSIC